MASIIVFKKGVGKKISGNYLTKYGGARKENGETGPSNDIEGPVEIGEVRIKCIKA